MCHRVVPLACYVILMIFRWRWFQTLSRGLMSLHYACMFCFWNHVGFTTLRFSFLRAGALLCSFFFCKALPPPLELSTFSLRFWWFLCIRIFRIDETNASQSSSIVEFWLLVCPCLLFSLLSGFYHFGSDFRPQILRSGSCLNFCQSPPGPHVSRWRFLSIQWTSFFWTHFQSEAGRWPCTTRASDKWCKDTKNKKNGTIQNKRAHGSDARNWMKQRHIGAACLTFSFVHSAKTLSTLCRLDEKGLLPLLDLGFNPGTMLEETAQGSRVLSYGWHVLCTGHMWSSRGGVGGNLTNFDSRPRSKKHQHVSLATRPDLKKQPWSHQCILVEQGMFLLSALRVELVVRCDDG